MKGLLEINLKLIRVCLKNDTIQYYYFIIKYLFIYLLTCELIMGILNIY